MWTKLLFVCSFAVTLTQQRSIKDLWNEQTSTIECHCNWRLLRHYEAKGCEATETDACGCPAKFDCPKANEIEENDRACYYKGREYASGSIINTTNLCESCRCTNGPQARIVCTPVECLNFNAPPEPDCHFLYDEGQCCPSRIICDRYGTLEDDSQQESSFACEYEGKKYPLGARMFSSVDPCEICVCTEDWQERNSTCYQQDCVLEKYKAKLMDGCVPIYAEQTCCPIEFYCAPDDIFMSEDEERENDIEKTDSRCVFGNRYYDIGKSLSVNQESTCITCTCHVPPDFTCLHKSCPPNPNQQSCQPYFTSDDCCPKYDCLFGDETPTIDGSDDLRETEDEADGFDFTNAENPCIEINCSEGRSCMLYQMMCGNETCPPVPTCMKTNSSCPTPQCAEGCVVTEQDINRCPTCVCGEEIEKRAADMIRCTMPRCFGESCFLVADEDGCPTCSCRQPCEVPQCRPGCNVLLEHEGACPKCICEDETEGCPTPLCEHEGCRIETSPNGCPTCMCDRALSAAPANRELEMEGSNINAETVSFQFPQQQQQQDFEIPAGSPFDGQSPPDDYDEMTVMTRRSPQMERKPNAEQISDRKTFESRTEHKISTKNGSSAANSLNATEKKDGRDEP